MGVTSLTRRTDEIVFELISTGLTHHQTTLLAQLLATRSESVRERSGERSQAALRARRWREKQAEIQDKPGMAGQKVADGATRSNGVRERDAERSAPLILSSLPLEKRTFEEVRKEEEKEKRARAKRKPAIPLPDDWQPKPTHYAAAARLGCPPSFADDKAEDLRIWAKQNDARKVDWDATLHGFMRRDAEQWKAKHAKAGNVVDAADRLKAKLAEFNKPAPSFVGDGAICDGQNQADVRLLSQGGRERS